MSQNQSRISVLIPWRGHEALAIFLRRNAQWFGAHDAEIMILNCGGENSSRLRSLILESKTGPIRQLDIHESTNKAFAINIGALYSRSIYLLIMEPIFAFASDFLSEALTCICHNGYVTTQWIAAFNLQGIRPFEGPMDNSCLESVIRSRRIDVALTDGTVSEELVSREDILAGTTQGYGVIFMSRNDFLRAGGYNSALRDNQRPVHMEFGMRLRHLGFQQIQSGTVTRIRRNVIMANPAPEMVPTNRAAQLVNLRVALSKRQLQGTYLQDVSRWTDLSSKQTEQL